jgi:hypothetical protein
MQPALLETTFFGGAEMPHFSVDDIRQKLFFSIDSLLDDRDTLLNNPNASFTRKKKISFLQTVLFTMTVGSDDVNEELESFFEEDKIPYPSAMIQRRSQIKPEAFVKLFDCFTEQIPLNELFMGYQVVAGDGSRLNLPYNPSDSYTFYKCIKKRKGMNQLHLNALYDVMNDVFLDVVLQSVPQMDEKAAFCEILDKNKLKDESRKRIYLADRGYSAFNVFAHAIHNGQLFLIRMPEANVKTLCPDLGNWLDGEHVDREVTINIGRRNTKKNRQLENYHSLSKSRRYDYAKAGSDEVDTLKFRILKFPIGKGSFEYIATNLPAYSFGEAVIKRLYHLRWNEETAFRHLKYAGRMVNLHSLKPDFTMQEIYAKLTMYNFSSFVMKETAPDKKTDKYTYKVNHTKAQKSCVKFLKGLIKDLKKLISKHYVPVRLEREFGRTLRRQSADTLNYR